MASARIALNLWASLASITFKEVNFNGYTDSASILFGNFSNNDYTNFAYSPTSNNQSFSSSQGDIWLNIGRFKSMISPTVGSDVFKRVVHEIGHAIGLSHPGDYNTSPGVSITYSNDAVYIEDSLQYSIMSYFDASETGANHVYNNQKNYAANSNAA